jgi:hypothetical protein
MLTVAIEGGGGGDEQRDGELLRLLKLEGWVGDLPGVPVFEEDGFEVRRAEDVGEVVTAGGVENVGEAFVGGEAGEDLEGVGSAVCEGVGRGIGVGGGVVEVGGELRRVAGCGEAEGFHRDGLGVEFEGVA